MEQLQARRLSVIAILSTASVAIIVAALLVRSGEEHHVEEESRPQPLLTSEVGELAGQDRIDTPRRALPELQHAGKSEPARGGNAVEGKVVDIYGFGIAGAWVYLDPRSPHEQMGATLATSDSGGHFAVNELPGLGTLLASAPGYVTVVPWEIPPNRAAAPPVIIVGPEVTYAGTVVDSLGVGIPDVAIRIAMSEHEQRQISHGRQRSRATEWATLTDALGRFSIEKVGWSPSLGLRAIRAGFEPAKTPLPEYSDSSILVLLVPISDAYVGKVLTPSLDEAAGALVVLGTRDAVADEHGRFAFEDYDPGQPDELMVLYRGLLPTHYNSADIPGTHEHPACLVLREIAGCLEGIVAGVDGAPMDGVHVALADATPLILDGRTLLIEEFLAEADGGIACSTVNGGKFRLCGLLSRPYTIVMTAPSLCAEIVAGVSAGYREFAISAGAGGRAALVAGKVQSADREPLAGVFVSLRLRYSLPDGRMVAATPALSTYTDEGGGFRFEAGCLEGAYLTVASPGLTAVPPCDIDPENSANIEIIVPQQYRIQVFLEGELARASVEGDWFVYLVDRKGRPQQVRQNIGAESRQGIAVILVGGRSEILLIDSSVVGVRLYKDGNLVRDEAISLLNSKEIQEIVVE